MAPELRVASTTHTVTHGLCLLPQPLRYAKTSSHPVPSRFLKGQSIRISKRGLRSKALSSNIVGDRFPSTDGQPRAVKSTYNTLTLNRNFIWRRGSPEPGLGGAVTHLP